MERTKPKGRRTRSRFLAWEGDKSRPLMVYRPCSCGCDTRAGVLGVGYLSGSDADGNGFTLWVRDEETFARFAAIFR